MSDFLPMVKVVAKSERGWRWINERDFDPKVNVLFGAAKKAEAAPDVEPKRGPGRPKNS